MSYSNLFFRRFSTISEPCRRSDSILVDDFGTERTEGVVELINEGSFHWFKIQTMLLVGPFCRLILFSRGILQQGDISIIQIWKRPARKQTCNNKENTETWNIPLKKSSLPLQKRNRRSLGYSYLCNHQPFGYLSIYLVKSREREISRRRRRRRKRRRWKRKTERRKNNTVVDAFTRGKVATSSSPVNWRNETSLDIFSNQQISKIFSSSGKISSHRLYLLLLFPSFI